MINLPANQYRIAKEVAINLASLGIPLSFAAGFVLGQGNWFVGVLLLLSYMVIDNCTGRLWFYVMENIAKRGK